MANATHRNAGVFLRVLALLATLLAGAGANADVYQWKDASGRTHFSDQKPADSNSAAAATRTAPSPTQAAPRLTITIEDPDNVLDADARALTEAGVTKIFAVYRGLFHLNLRKPVAVNITLFADHAALAAWVAHIHAGTPLPPGVLGLYVPQQNSIGVWKHSKDSNVVIATLLHEASHVLISQLSPNAPAWLQEGMAQYFEGLDPASDGYVIRASADPKAAIDTWIARKNLVTLKQYFSLDDARWRHLAHVQQNAIPYAVAWSVCYFMMSKPVGRQIINELLQDMEKTRRPPTADAIEKRYPGGYALMEYEWFKWAQGEKPPQRLSW